MTAEERLALLDKYLEQRIKDLEKSEKLKDAMGVVVDLEKNNVRGETRVISAETSKVGVAIIPTNEELVIARDTARLLGL